ncbi:uncharacterized protein LOC114525234 [Dendronephthya gigantea]|uniref:uncharacterized protein LOC114525234 n=1 Tax=Dendronephthya gigantea TaxID=151771 RepID=UPI00106A3CDA|nr:uncharacterized protein LOC114525234 [Dendronephthya gigantea]XP_028402259.1 uncharacterized protein LOC114525234 [Dendronephthya gigantea]
MDFRSQEANYTRLAKLLVNKGTEALRNTFDTIHPPVSLPGVLAANKTFLQGLKPRVIKNFQLELLFPPSGNPPDSKTFDITLFVILFRNICSLVPPSTGWNEMPPDTDRSMEANIVRIKLLRNKVFAHAVSTQVDDSRFRSLWAKISLALVQLNIPQSDIDEIKTGPSGLEGRAMECENHELTLAVMTDFKHDIATCAQRRDEDILLTLAHHRFDTLVKNKAELFPCGKNGWLLKEVDIWFVKIDSESMVLLLTAGPRFGKTEFAAKVCEDFKKSKQLAACFFFDSNNSNLSDPMVVLECLASQMSENLPTFKKLLLDNLKRPHQIDSLKAAFQVYFKNTLDDLDLVEPVLIVMDGLNKISPNKKDEMINLIRDYFPELPKYMKFLVTSTPEIALAKLNNVQAIDVQFQRLPSN